MSDRPIRIATRNSRLALWQANHIAQLLQETSRECETELVHVSTLGDRDKTESLSQLGGFGVFTREVQKAVLDDQADIAVHSLKDLPTESVEGLKLAAVPQRGPMFDAIVLARTIPTELWLASSPLDNPDKLNERQILPEKARVGTGSLRRRAQLLCHRPDLQLLDVRGNIETRLKKLDEGQYDALILAEAGLRRLGLDDRVSVQLRCPIMYPAVAQGAIGVECRQNDGLAQSVLDQINDPGTFHAVSAERSLLASLRAGCHAPLGVVTHYTASRLMLEAVVLSVDGRQRLVANASGAPQQAYALGRQVAESLSSQGAGTLIDEARSNR